MGATWLDVLKAFFDVIKSGVEFLTVYAKYIGGTLGVFASVFGWRIALKKLKIEEREQKRRIWDSKKYVFDAAIKICDLAQDPIKLDRSSISEYSQAYRDSRTMFPTEVVKLLEEIRDRALIVCGTGKLVREIWEYRKQPEGFENIVERYENAQSWLLKQIELELVDGKRTDFTPLEKIFAPYWGVD